MAKARRKTSGTNSTRRKTGRNSASRKTSSTRASASRGNGRGQDAIALLKADHRQVEEWFEQFEKARSDEKKQDLATKICRALKAHTVIEEEIFYPAFLEATGETAADAGAAAAVSIIRREPRRRGSRRAQFTPRDGRCCRRGR